MAWNLPSSALAAWSSSLPVQAMSRADFKPPQDHPQREAHARVEVAGNELTLFEESPALVDAMLADIRAAKTRVWMESYIFVDDEAGRAIAEALAVRAAAGLDVRLMIDAWGSFNLPTATINRLRAAGVLVHVFHDFGEAFHRRLKFLQVLNQRNHRKLLVIDDAIAYFGGMNIVDQSGIRSTDDAKARHLPASAGWRDVHVRLVGPKQAEIAESCLRLWRRVHHQKSSRGPLAGQGSAQGHGRRDFLFRLSAIVQVPTPATGARAADSAGAARDHAGDGLLSADGTNPARVLRARRRGVRVNVIVPGHSDVKVVQWVLRHAYEFLLKRGIRIYERRDRMLHSKIMTVDGRWSVIGSCNWDARSLRLNLEFFAVIRSEAMAAALDHTCREEIRASVRVTPAYCRRRYWWQRMLHRTAWSTAQLAVGAAAAQLWPAFACGRRPLPCRAPSSPRGIDLAPRADAATGGSSRG